LFAHMRLCHQAV